MLYPSLVGCRIRLRYDHIRDVITFSARVVREGLDGDCRPYVTVCIPERVRALPFPPGGRQADGKGPKFLRYHWDVARIAVVSRPSPPDTIQRAIDNGTL